MPRRGSQSLVRAAALALTGLAVTACGAAGQARVPRVRTIAFLRAVDNPGSPTETALLRELGRAGFVTGRSLRVLGASEGGVHASPQDAARAVRSWTREGAELVVAFSTSGARAAREASPRTNILFLSNDPTAAGLVRDEGRPDGRLTGVTIRVPADRTLSLASRLVPGLSRIGLAYPDADPAAVPDRDRFASAADGRGMQLLAEAYEAEQDPRPAIDTLVRRGAQALLLLSSSPTAARALAAFEAGAAAHRLPVVASTDLATFALLALYPDGSRLGAQLGRQAVLLLRGAAASAIPVEDPRRFMITMNEAMAVSLGLTIPDDVAREADLVRR